MNMKIGCGTTTWADISKFPMDNFPDWFKIKFLKLRKPMLKEA